MGAGELETLVNPRAARLETVAVSSNLESASRGDALDAGRTHEAANALAGDADAVLVGELGTSSAWMRGAP